jgi:hypothetical protein
MPKGKQSRRWQRSDWFALCAVIISVLSFSTSLEQCEDKRLHDQPRLFFEFDTNTAGAGWNIENLGLGPAELRGFAISVDGKPIYDLTDLAKLLGVSPPYAFAYTLPTVSIPYAPGIMKTLFWVSAEPDATALRNHWTTVRIMACYCSIHDECWLFDSAHIGDPKGDPRDDSCKEFKDLPKSRWWNG